jgi:hypothetical protein
VYGTHTIEWDNDEYIVMFDELTGRDSRFQKKHDM